MPNFYKPGHKVRIIGEPEVYTVHTVYSPTEVSLGLLDYPDTEQDYIINVNQLVYVNDMSMIYCSLHHRHYDSDYDEDCPKCLDESLPICNACEG